MQKRATFKVSFDMPEGADTEQAKQYVLEAVQSWRGGLDPLDEMFDLDHTSVKVVYERGSIKSAKQQAILDEFIKFGKEASMHFADDSTKEWGKGYEAQRGALTLFDTHPELQDRMREVAKDFLWSLQRERPIVPTSSGGGGNG